MKGICDTCKNCLIRTYGEIDENTPLNTSWCLINNEIIQDYGSGSIIPVKECNRYVSNDKVD